MIAEIEADPKKAIAGLEAFDRKAKAVAQDETKTIHVKVETSAFQKAARALRVTMGGLKFGALYAGATMVGGAFAGLAGLAGGLVGALGPLSGLLATLPAGFAAMGAGIATAALGLSGITDGVTAYKESLDGSAASMKKWQEASKNMTPAGREFVKFLVKDFMPAFKQVKDAAQSGLLPGVQSGLEAMTPRFKGLSVVVGQFATTMGDAFKEMAQFWSGAERSKQLGDTFKGVNLLMRDMLKLAMPLSRILVSVVDAARPMTQILTNGLNKELSKLATWMEKAEGQQAMISFFGTALKFTRLWGQVLKPLVGILASVTKAAEPLATWMLKELADWLDKVNKNAASVGGQTKMKAFFESMKPAIRETAGLLKDLAKVLFTSSEGGEESAFVKTLKAFRKTAVPALANLLKTLDKSNFGPKFAEFLGHVADGLSALSRNDGVFTLLISGINGVATALGALSKVTGGKSTDALLALMTGAAALKMGAKATGGLLGVPTGKGKQRKGGLAGTLLGDKKKGGGRKGSVLTRGAKAVGGGAKKGGKAVGSGALLVGGALATTVKAAATSAAAMAKWAASVVASGAKAAAGMAASAAKIVAKYAWMAAQALINAVKMAATWFIALGPIGWIGLAIAALVVLIIKNWDTVKKYTALVWDWVWSKIKAIVGFIVKLFLNFTPVGLIIKHFGTIKNAIGTAWDWVKKKTSDTVDWFKGIPGKISKALSGMWSGIKSGLVEVLNWAIGKINSLIDKINKIPKVNIGKISPISTVKPKSTPKRTSGQTRYKGGPVYKGQSYVVGEHRPEMFTPSQNGRIMPKVNADGGGGGITEAQMQRLLDRVIEKSKPDVTMNNEFPQGTDHRAIANDLAWKIGA